MAPRLLALSVTLAALIIATAAPARAACSDPTVPLQATIKFQNAPADVTFRPLPSPTPIKIVVQVENCSGAPVLTGENFSSTDFFRRLYFTNEGLVINKAEETLHSDAPTYFCQSRGGTQLTQTIPVVPVEVLAGAPPGSQFFREYVIDDARKLYDMSKPGHYEVELRFDLLTFDAGNTSAVINDCDQFPGTTVVNVAAATGRHAFTIASNKLEFLISPAVTANSTIVGTSPVVADGVDASTITITLKDAQNTPVAGVIPTFSATGSNNTLGVCSETDAAGVSTCSLRSTTPEVKTLSIVTPFTKTGGTVTFAKALGAARVWAGLTNSDDVGLAFDLQTIVRCTGFCGRATRGTTPVTIGSGEMASIKGTSSGFNNAALSHIPLALDATSVSPGDTISVEVLVRNACAGSNKISGRVRLWYDGAFNGPDPDTGPNHDAATRLDLRITPATTLFLHAGGVLNSTPGASRTSLDKLVGARCGPYQSFGVWTTP